MDKMIYFKAAIIFIFSALLAGCSLEGDILALRKKYVESHFPSVAPSAPATAPTVIAGSEQLTVSWQAIEGANAYEVWAGIANNSNTATKRGDDVSDLSAVITGLTNGTTYYVWIKAKNNVGISGFSPVASGIPSIPITTAPQAPSTPTVSTSDGQIIVTWTAVEGATAYEVWLGTENNSALASKYDVSSTTVTLTNLTNGTTYYVWIKAKNSVGTSGFSPVASGIPSILIIVPQAPSTPTVSTSDGRITVTWEAVEGATAYEVWAETINYSDIATKRGDDVSSTSAVITGLTNGTTYYVWVKAKNSVGTSGFSPVASGKPIGTPGAPTVTPGLAQLQVTWTAVPGADEYEVYYGTSTPTTLATTTAVTTATIIGLTGNTIYYFCLRAKNSTGVSDYGPNAIGVTGNEYRPGLYQGTEKIGTQNLSEALSYISSNAVSGNNFYIVLGADESASPMNLNYSGKTVRIMLIGYGGERTITLAYNGSMFSINSGVTLTLDENITLVGRTNSASLVNVNSGNLVINAGAKISGNNVSNGYGGGININNGTLTMNGGTINGNTAGMGGGIHVSGGTLIMNGGTISGNTARGGGIVVSNGTVTMYSGTISGNSSVSQGGGVEVYGSGTFTMHGGVISGNTASTYGGGICVSSYSATFKKLPSDGRQNSGIIYGSEETGVDTNGVPLKNTAGISSTHAVDYPSSRRNTTAGQTDHIDTTTGRGLSGSGNPPYGQ